MSGWVTVTGPPRSICCLKNGDDASRGCRARCRSARPRTRAGASAPRRARRCSATRLVAPITLDGATALSVEISTKRRTPASMRGVDDGCACPRRCWRPLRRAGPPSAARACGPRHGRRPRAGSVAITARMRAGSRTSAMTGWKRTAGWTSRRRFIDVEDRVLAMAEEDHVARPGARDLAAQLGPDRTRPRR